MRPNQLSSWFSWRGRINRWPYLLSNLWVGILGKAVEGVFSNNSVSAAEGLGWLLAVILVSYFAIMIAIKRAHDRGRPGYFLLLLLVPILNLWPIIELGFFRGTDGPNRFGQDPLKEPGLDADSAQHSDAPDVPLGERSRVVDEVTMAKESHGVEPGFLVGLIVGAAVVLLTGLAVFYWTHWGVSVKSSMVAEEPVSKAASSGIRLPAATTNVTPPDSQAAVKIIRLGRKGSEADVTKLWFQYSFTLGGERYHVVFTQTPQVDSLSGAIEDCHACEVMAGAVTYKLVANHWELLSTQRNVSETGAYGEAPSMETAEFLEFSDESGAILIPSDGIMGGIAERGTQLYVFSSAQWRSVGRVETGVNNAGACDPQESPSLCYDYEGTISVVGEKTGAFPDLVVTYTGTDRNGKTPPSDHYRFDGEKYQLRDGKKGSNVLGLAGIGGIK